MVNSFLTMTNQICSMRSLSSETHFFCSHLDVPNLQRVLCEYSREDLVPVGHHLDDLGLGGLVGTGREAEQPGPAHGVVHLGEGLTPATQSHVRKKHLCADDNFFHFFYSFKSLSLSLEDIETWSKELNLRRPYERFALGRPAAANSAQSAAHEATAFS